MPSCYRWWEARHPTQHRVAPRRLGNQSKAGAARTRVPAAPSRATREVPRPADARSACWRSAGRGACVYAISTARTVRAPSPGAILLSMVGGSSPDQHRVAPRRLGNQAKGRVDEPGRERREHRLGLHGEVPADQRTRDGRAGGRPGGGGVCLRDRRRPRSGFEAPVAGARPSRRWSRTPPCCGPPSASRRAPSSSRNMIDTNVIPLALIDEVVVRQVLVVRAAEKRYVSPAIGNSFFRTDPPQDRPRRRDRARPTPTTSGTGSCTWPTARAGARARGGCPPYAASGPGRRSPACVGGRQAAAARPVRASRLVAAA